MGKESVKRTERGWIGHGLLASRCLFRRNTLLEYDDLKIVVSTIGMLADIHTPGYPNTCKIIEVGCGRYYEVAVFHVDIKTVPFLDPDVCQRIYFDSEWQMDNEAFNKKDSDMSANEMHEKVIEEIAQKLLAGESFSTGNLED